VPRKVLGPRKQRTRQHVIAERSDTESKRMAGVTYGRLDTVLRSLDFSFREVKKKPARVYEHQATGALLAFPEMPAGDEVIPRHLLAVRATLENYGISAPPDIAALLQNGS
jgi:hypothetical protein